MKTLLQGPRLLLVCALLLTACDDGGAGGGAGGADGAPPDASPDGGAACPWTVPVESAAQGDYRHYSHFIGVSIGSVAISNGGYRAVAGGTDGKLYMFDRSSAEPRFSYTTGDQVNTVDIARDGSAFVAGASGKIFVFTCDASTPAWVYDTAGDLSSGSPVVEGVSISADGRFVAAVSRRHVYLFGQESPTPLLRLALSEIDSLATVALSADGSHLVVGTRPEATGSRVFYLDRQKLLWTYSMPDLGWGPNDLPTPVALSADGAVVVAGGRDNRVHHFAAASSEPDWTYEIAADSPVFSVALSDDGHRLAVTGNFQLFFFDDASVGTPTYSYDGSYASTSQFGDVVVYPASDNAPGEYGVGNYLHAVGLSADGNYVAAGDYVYGHAYSFHRGFGKPFRLYDLGDKYDAVVNVDLSPDGAWVMLGSAYSGEIARFEVAPSEHVSVAVPLTYSIEDPDVEKLAELIGGTKFKVDYTLVKPGRAATLKEEWSMWAFSGGVLFPPIEYLCTGDREWSYDQDLADGNQIVTGTRELAPPQCMSKEISTVDLLILHAQAVDEPSKKALSDSSALLANIQVGKPQ